MNYAIGELAKGAGYAVQTIRYYEQIGLMPEPARTPGGQRRYGNQHVQRLGFIRRARDLGFSVEDIRSLLDLANKPEQSCASVDDIAETQLAAIDGKIAALKTLRREIGAMLSCCDKTNIAECNVIGSLAKSSSAAPKRSSRQTGRR